MNYRLMKKEDIEGVYDVEVSAFKDPWSISSITNEYKNNLSRYIVAEDEDGRILGYMGAWYIIDEAHITNVAVHSDARGRGIGNKLVEYFIEMCKKDNICSMTLEVRNSNLVAQGLYKKYGFIPGGVRKEYYSDNREDAIIMWKQLKEVAF